MENSLLQIEPWLWLCGTLVYIEIVWRLDRFLSRKKSATDEEYLAYLARKYRVSEHDLFFYAAQKWAYAEKRVEADFKDYLIRGHLPHYVRDFVRREKTLLKGSG